MRRTQKNTYHHGNLRHALIEAAIPVLRDKGVVGLSLRELAGKLGVSHGAPYRHFRNKTELLEGIALAGYRELAKICATSRERYPLDPDKQLFEAGIGYVEYVSGNREIANLMFGGVLSLQDCGPDLREAADEAVAGLAAIIDNGKRAGLFGSRNTGDLVLTTLSAVHGLALLISAGLVEPEQTSGKGLRMLCTSVYETLMQGLLERDT
ncbi:MAG: TetR/AcrR family transcriptional regulator [Thiogranum sp.]|nr:TetR/AcrR family transcriptional regulator [Thiogranum sp.]